MAARLIATLAISLLVAATARAGDATHAGPPDAAIDHHDTRARLVRELAARLVSTTGTADDECGNGHDCSAGPVTWITRCVEVSTEALRFDEDSCSDDTPGDPDPTGGANSVCVADGTSAFVARRCCIVHLGADSRERECAAETGFQVCIEGDCDASVRTLAPDRIETTDDGVVIVDSRENGMVTFTPSSPDPDLDVRSATVERRGAAGFAKVASRGTRRAAESDFGHGADFDLPFALIETSAFRAIGTLGSTNGDDHEEEDVGN